MFDGTITDTTTSYPEKHAFIITEQDEWQYTSTTTSIRDWSDGTEEKLSKL